MKLAILEYEYLSSKPVKCLAFYDGKQWFRIRVFEGSTQVLNVSGDISQLRNRTDL